MAAVYSYPAKPFRADQLEEEIRSAGLPDPSEVRTVGKSLEVLFAAPLADSQKSTLDAVVAAHVPRPDTPEEAKDRQQLATMEAFLTLGTPTPFQVAQAVRATIKHYRRHVLGK